MGEYVIGGDFSNPFYLQTHPSKRRHSSGVPQIHGTSVNTSSGSSGSSANRPSSLHNQRQSTGSILASKPNPTPQVNGNLGPLPVSLRVAFVLKKEL